jgi:hypothetical protein
MNWFVWFSFLCGHIHGGLDQCIYNRTQASENTRETSNELQEIGLSRGHVKTAEFEWWASDGYCCHIK